MELDHEMETYRKHLPALLEKDAGRFVLIHGDDLIGVFDTKEKALEAGYERWLFEAFLVDEIVAEKKPGRIG
jgi:hypothetical protein